MTSISAGGGSHRGADEDNLSANPYSILTNSNIREQKWKTDVIVRVQEENQ
jgi:hypothetical protein